MRVCEDCTTRFAVPNGIGDACPHCGSALSVDEHEENAMPKISRDGGPSVEGQAGFMHPPTVSIHAAPEDRPHDNRNRVERDDDGNVTSGTEFADRKRESDDRPDGGRIADDSPESFDPNGRSEAEVLAYLREQADENERTRVLRMERAGQNRDGITKADIGAKGTAGTTTQRRGASGATGKN